MSISLALSVPSPIANYEQLQDKILKWMDREGDAAAIELCPDWIQLAESWFNRELRTPQMEQTVTFSLEDEERPLPSDYLAMRSIYQETDPDKPLDGMSPDQLRRSFGGIAGTPSAYTIVNNSIRVAPVPETELLYTMDYFANLAPLSVVAPSNWLLEMAPDLYLAAALYYGYDWMDNPEKADRYGARAVSILERLKVTTTASRWGAGTRPHSIRQASRGRC